MVPPKKRPLAGKSIPASGKVILVGVGPSAITEVGIGVGVLVAVGVGVGAEQQVEVDGLL